MSRANQNRRTGCGHNTARAPSPHARAEGADAAGTSKRINDALALCGFFLSAIDPVVLHDVIRAAIVHGACAVLAFAERARHAAELVSRHARACTGRPASLNRRRRHRATRSPSTPDRRPS